MQTSAVQVRELTLKDISRVLEIDEAVTGQSRREGDNDLWRLIAETTTCFGAVLKDRVLEGASDRRSDAEMDNRLVGFVLADVRPWEFGNRAHVGWVIALGVDPAHQKHGVGRALGERVVHQFEKLGVSQFKTLVDKRNTVLLDYFKSLGFREGREVVLERGSK